MGPLPLLNFTAGLYPEVDLRNVTLIACQHILDTLIDLLEELYCKGLDPKNVFILGKCYSTNKETMQCFPEDTVSPFSISFDPSRDYDDQYREYVEKFVDDCFRKGVFTTSKKILVLDDGGFLLQRVNEIISDIETVSGIEQTSSGLSKIKDENLRFGIVNVARSEAKLQIESPLIAKVFVQELKRKIGSLSEKKFLSWGKGLLVNH